MRASAAQDEVTGRIIFMSLDPCGAADELFLTRLFTALSDQSEIKIISDGRTTTYANGEDAEDEKDV